MIRFETFATATDLRDTLQTQGISHIIYVADVPLGLRYEEHYYALIDTLRADCSTLLATTSQHAAPEQVIELRSLESQCSSSQQGISP